MRFLDLIRGSIRRKTMAVVLVTTFVALLVNGLALLAYELRTYRQTQLDDVRTQAEILGRAAAPALAFNDRQDAANDLATLRVRPDVLVAGLYAADGRLFASYERDPGGASALPERAAPAGQRMDGDLLTVWHEIREGGEPVGGVYVVARSGLYQRIVTSIGILTAVMAAALAVALFLSSWLQHAVTDPIVAIEAAARSVVERRDFTVRARKTTDDEVGVLAEAFNRMLSEVEKRQEELRLADRRKDEFLATLAHELRNPLAPIRNAVYLMKVAPENAQAMGDARDMIDRQVQQMVRLVDDLIDVSRITTGKLALRRERVEVGAVARSALEAVEPLARARGHTLSTHLPRREIHLSADATRLTQVFLNLLNNAIKFTDPGGQIDFHVAVEGAELVARVRDNGIGIPGEQLESIFAMFAQADRSLERSAGGLGVGLALSRRLVELHGGTVQARSEGVGRGSEFVVRIPLPLVEGESRRDRGARTPGGGRQHRILLVDDNQDFAISLAIVLRGLGHEVRVEHDGEAGLAAALEFHPDIAFLDIGMPKMNGFELARGLRAAPESASAILVAITGFSQPADRERAKESGFDQYFVKPVEIERLQEILAAN